MTAPESPRQQFADLLGSAVVRPDATEDPDPTDVADQVQSIDLGQGVRGTPPPLSPRLAFERFMNDNF